MKKEKKEEIEFLEVEVVKDKKNKNKRKQKKKEKVKVIYIVLFLVLILLGIGCFLLDRYQEKIGKQERKNTIVEVKKHYSTYVKTTKQTKIYDKNEKEIGLYGKDVELILKEEKINENTKYFKTDEGSYVSYKDVTPIENLTTYDTRYKNYVVFNESIVTKDKTTLYDEKNNLVYSFNKSFTFPIIVKKEKSYGVEYQNRLLYVKKEDVKEEKKAQNTKEETRDNIRTLTYHTIYNTETEKCTNTVICHPIEQFDSHMKYISEQHYFTLTMQELEMFLNQEIRIPKKSIVITLDDGKYAQNAVDIVEKYKVNATYFIISSRYDVKNIKTTYMNFQSHSYNLHNNYKCKGGEQGGQLLCEDKDKVLEDLRKSKESLGGDVFAFAYPFFDWNERAKELLSEAGFRLAFIGQYNTDGFSTYSTEHLMLRRKTIFSTDDLNVLEGYLRA